MFFSCLKIYSHPYLPLTIIIMARSLGQIGLLNASSFVPLFSWIFPVSPPPADVPYSISFAGQDHNSIASCLNGIILATITTHCSGLPFILSPIWTPQYFLLYTRGINTISLWLLYYWWACTPCRTPTTIIYFPPFTRFFPTDYGTSPSTQPSLLQKFLALSHYTY